VFSTNDWPTSTSAGDARNETIAGWATTVTFSDATAWSVRVASVTVTETGAVFASPRVQLNRVAFGVVQLGHGTTQE